MPSAIIRERAMSSCSLVIPTSAARGLCHAASDWVGSFAISIRRQHKIARPRFNLPLSHHRCNQEIAEARATRFATPLSQLRRLVELATRRTNYKFLRQSNFLTIRLAARIKEGLGSDGGFPENLCDYAGLQQTRLELATKIKTITVDVNAT